MKLRFLLILCAFSAVEALGSWLDDRDSVFFSPELGSRIASIRSFPATWWNFVVVEDEASVDSVCQLIRDSGLSDRIVCGDSALDFGPILDSWAADIALRKKAPSQEEITRAFSQSLAQATLPLPESFLEILRRDPFGEYRKLYQKSVSRMPIQFRARDGVFRGEGRAILMVHPNFPPSDFQKGTAFIALTKKLSESGVSIGIVGPHASTFENRSRVQADLGRVSKVGLILIILIGIVAWRLKRWRLCLAVPLVFGAGAASTLATVFVFGSVHGLVLSFGSGIIGLTLDYAFHAAFAKGSHSVWRANIMGVLTSLVVFVVLAFSSIPLTRQLAVFSILGLSLGFLFVYSGHRFFPMVFRVEPIRIALKGKKFISRVGIALGVGVIPLLLKFEPSFSLRDLDYRSENSRKLQKWVFEHMGTESPLMELSKKNRDGMEDSRHRLEFAKGHSISLQTVADFLPSDSDQMRNLATWRELACPEWKTKFSAEERVFFEPFFQDFRCNRLKTRALDGPPKYLADLVSEGQVLHVWLPREKGERDVIRTRFPGATSFLDLINQFPRELDAELRWMAPTALIVILGILWAYFRRLGYAMAALLPVGVGLGGIGWAHLLGMPLSFVSLMGILMLLGLGVDYGIFAVDHAIRKSRQGDGSDDPLNSALILCAASTVGGYLPLLFCGHPVLLHLGQVLTLGTLGASLGAFWVIPTLFGRRA